MTGIVLLVTGVILNANARVVPTVASTDDLNGIMIGATGTF